MKKHLAHFLVTGLGVLTGVVLQVFAKPTTLPGQLGVWAPAALAGAKWLHHALTNTTPTSSGGE